MGQAYLLGYQAALEKIGFHDAELDALIKSAVTEGYEHFDPAPNPEAARWREYAQSYKDDLGHARRREDTAFKARDVARQEAAAQQQASQKALGEMGKQHNQYLNRLGKPTRWFGELSPLKKGLVGGAAGLGTLGLGLGLGHALSGD
jgi:hypothetical protein